MGAWEELDTEISIEVDTSDLEAILDIDDEFDIFEPVTKSLEKFIENIHDGSKEAVDDISDRNKSFQGQIISQVCDNPSGMLASSIQKEEVNDGYGFIVGTIINHVYPMAVEYGRSEVYPINAKALAFYYKGELIFRKRVGEAKPRPFVAPAYEKTDSIAEEIVLRKIEIAKQRI